MPKPLERVDPATVPWVLVRGLTRGSGHWGSFTQAWQAAWPRAQVLVLDAPGCGTRWRERSPMDVGDLMADLRSQVHARTGTVPVRLLALSLGAMVATEWAVRHPTELAAMVLVNTSMRPHNTLTQRLRPAQWPGLVAALLLPTSARKLERRVWRLTSRLHSSAVVADWVALRQCQPVSRANAWRQLLAAARFQGPQGAPGVPALLLAGAADALVDPACSQAVARAWGAALRLHPDAGHDLPLDDPDWVIAQVQATWPDAVG